MSARTFFTLWFAAWVIGEIMVGYFGGLRVMIVFNLAFTTLNIIGATVTAATGRGPWRRGPQDKHPDQITGWQ